MSSNHNKWSSPASASDVNVNAQAHVAHELANLLDGSLRNVSLVMKRLRDAQDQPARPEVSPELISRLDAANDAMRQMAHLIAQLQKGSRAGQSIDWSETAGLTLGDAVSKAMRQLGPMAEQEGVALRCHLEEQAAELSAGVLYPVIINLMRNSLQAICGTTHGRPGYVEVVAKVNEGWLELAVSDSGPGFNPSMFDEDGAFRFGVTTRPGGHGQGLMLVRDIVDALEGQLQMTARIRDDQGTLKTSGGACVRVRVAVDRL